MRTADARSVCAHEPGAWPNGGRSVCAEAVTAKPNKPAIRRLDTQRLSTQRRTRRFMTYPLGDKPALVAEAIIYLGIEWNCEPSYRDFTSLTAGHQREKSGR